jgi:hypothetical protein
MEKIINLLPLDIESYSRILDIHEKMKWVFVDIVRTPNRGTRVGVRGITVEDLSSQVIVYNSTIARTPEFGIREAENVGVRGLLSKAREEDLSS